MTIKRCGYNIEAKVEETYLKEYESGFGREGQNFPPF